MKKIIATIVIILILINNHNYKELSNLAIITNISITKQKNEYKVTFQELIPIKEENRISKQFKYYTNTNSSLKKAFYSIDNDIIKEIYINHLENIIINSKYSDTINKLSKVLNTDLDNFNIILTTSNPNKVLKYSNNYKYVNSIIKNNITLREIKKNTLENKMSNIPIVKLEKNRLIFSKYKKVGGNNNA